MIRNTPSRDSSGLVRFKSTCSSGPEIDSCVEVATEPATVHVRDSKNLDGPRLAFAPAAWAGFLPYAVEG
ncbi:DUF397 domain-containing protein [Streptomyces sp. NPDC057236]|uniref:DUF397 domain-containing protein n=1 Tax=Streptomyces sp. NPDC057236 TaxID=3346059 RepID=UPI0036457C98